MFFFPFLGGFGGFLADRLREVSQRNRSRFNLRIIIMYQKSRIKPYRTSNGLLWLGIFVVIALIPLVIAYTGRLPPVRMFLEEFGVALGFIGLSLFALQFLFSGRIKQVAPSFGVDNIVQFHKEIGVIAILLSK